MSRGFLALELACRRSRNAWLSFPTPAQVYDVTPYLGQHPGGDAILRNAGGDSTEGMHGPQHPSQALEILEQHFIGRLET